MNLWLWSLYFLPVSGALKTLPAVNLEGELGGSIIFKCPLPEKYTRVYLCREMAASGACATVVSNGNYVKNGYAGRVTLNLLTDSHLFLVEMTEITENDSGVYACGVGTNTDRGKTLQITLSVSKYQPFWEKELTLETPGWFHRLLYLTTASVPPWFQMLEDAIPSEFISKVTTPAQRPQTPPAHRSSSDTPVIHGPPISTASLVAAGKPPTLLPSITASKTSAQEEQVGPQPASYNRQTRLHRQRPFSHGLSGSEDQGFHILIPTILGLMLLALLGIVVKRAIQRRRVLSRRIRRLAVRMRALEVSQRPRSWQRPRVSQRQRSQNIYSACPRRARGADPAGEPAGAGQEPLPGRGAPEPSAPPQVPEAPWFHAPSLKASCEYVSCYHQPPAKMEDYNSDDYINISCLTHLPSCPPRSRPLCQ
ncbi:immunoglobulin mu Fc receptor isoform X1 [Loxodonta africana]|uniref:immunoglobulin mu Fc receptor isoform X1 n=1 Tax=Loxodonta africana TaxID=9785 RepID=UPI000C8129CE|nr:fas apoptotic inhibitory molecule 3 isoform X1 [Loxodonta africana]